MKKNLRIAGSAGHRKIGGGGELCLLQLPNPLLQELSLRPVG
jgi:hypothetical protein